MFCLINTNTLNNLRGKRENQPSAQSHLRPSTMGFHSIFQPAQGIVNSLQSVSVFTEMLLSLCRCESTAKTSRGILIKVSVQNLPSFSFPALFSIFIGLISGLTIFDNSTLQLLIPSALFYLNKKTPVMRDEPQHRGLGTCIFPSKH